MQTLSYGSSCTLPAVTDAPPLAVQQIDFTYPSAEHPALNNVSFTVNRGEMVALVGPNGAGKSTLLKLIVGMEQIQAGQIQVYGNQAGDCRHRVGYVPQRSAVDWSFPLTVREVVMMGRYPYLGWLRWPRQKDRAMVQNALEALQITELADQQVGELSGGQQQRVMLARTIAQDASLILMDEPLNNLDMPSQELIFHLLQDFAQEGRTVMVSTHDLGLLRTHFSRAVFIDRDLIADGPIEEILTPETLESAYGVPLHIH